jgi:hypothetical protein
MSAANVRREQVVHVIFMNTSSSADVGLNDYR